MSISRLTKKNLTPGIKRILPYACVLVKTIHLVAIKLRRIYNNSRSRYLHSYRRHIYVSHHIFPLFFFCTILFFLPIPIPGTLSTFNRVYTFVSCIPRQLNIIIFIRDSCPLGRKQTK